MDEENALQPRKHMRSQTHNLDLVATVHEELRAAVYWRCERVNWVDALVGCAMQSKDGLSLCGVGPCPLACPI